MELHFKHKPMEAKEVKFDISKINNIYNGLGDCCRCGCGGDYTYNTDSDGSNPEPKKIERMAKKFLKLAETRDVTSIDDYIFEVNASKDGKKDRVYTIYLKQKK